MSLADEAALLARKAGKPCGVAELHQGIRAELDAALALRDDRGKRKLSMASLSRALWKHHEIELNEAILARHVRGDCGC